MANGKAETAPAEKPTKKKRTRTSPKGFHVALDDETMRMIEDRCKESMREPKQEVAWIVREWMRKDAQKKESAKVQV